MKNIKVLSYNIHKGFTVRNKNFVLGDMRNAIRKLDPDIIFLQEVVGDHSSDKHIIDDWHNKIQFEYMAHELCEHYAYGKNAVYTEGHHGNAILSKYPILQWENIDISTNPLERRGLLHSVVEIPEENKIIHALCLHLNLLESGRKVQVKKICERIEKSIPHTEPLIIAGDFNDWRRKISKTLEENLEIKEAYLTIHGKHAKTFPSRSPILTLDRIYFRGLQCEKAEKLHNDTWKNLSDHIALFATFNI